jgi:membrane-anchored protein YejM (alkaline phosphatase superfamily)
MLDNGIDDRDTPGYFRRWWERGENCVVIVADSLRKDVYDAARMPNLRRCLTDEYTGHAMGTMTPPAFAAFMVGFPPFVSQHHRLLPHCVNLPATLMIEREYITGLFSSNGWAHPKMMPLQSGRPPWSMHSLAVADIENAMIAATQLFTIEAEAPVFGVLWSDRTHHPYISQKRSRIAEKRLPASPELREYEFGAQVAAAELMDYELAYFLDKYRDYGGGNVLFFADHGEYFGEAGDDCFGHGVYFPGHEEVLRVPVCVGRVK